MRWSATRRPEVRTQRAAAGVGPPAAASITTAAAGNGLVPLYAATYLSRPTRTGRELSTEALGESPYSVRHVPQQTPRWVAPHDTSGKG